MFCGNREFVVLHNTSDSSLAYGHYVDEPDHDIYVPSRNLKEKQTKKKIFEPNASFKVSNTLLRWIPIALSRNPEWADLSGKTTSETREPEEIDESLVSAAFDFLRENPEFVLYLKAGVAKWGRVSMQWAGEAYRWSLDALELPLLEIKKAQVERARAAFEKKHGAS